MLWGRPRPPIPPQRVPWAGLLLRLRFRFRRAGPRQAIGRSHCRCVLNIPGTRAPASLGVMQDRNEGFPGYRTKFRAALLHKSRARGTPSSVTGQTGLPRSAGRGQSTRRWRLCSSAPILTQLRTQVRSRNRYRIRRYDHACGQGSLGGSGGARTGIRRSGTHGRARRQTQACAPADAAVSLSAHWQRREAHRQGVFASGSPTGLGSPRSRTGKSGTGVRGPGLISLPS